MTASGICPKCNMRITQVKLEGVSVRGFQTSYLGVSYVCPSCSCVLSVAIDPLALKGETISAILKAMDKE